VPTGKASANGGKATAVDAKCSVDSSHGVVAIKRASDGALVNADHGFKRPNLPGPRSALNQKALDEDTYQDSLKAIIERDFFPELPFIRAREELEDAKQSRDPLRIQQAHANFRRCAATPGGRSMRTPQHGRGGPSVPGTPLQGSRGATPASEFGGSERATNIEDADREDEVHRITKGKRLDQFLNKYTSEDNQSASQLLLDDSVALEKSRMWVHEQALEFNTRQQKLIENGPRQEDGTLNMVLSAKYDETQALMNYTPKSECAPKLAVSRVGAVKEINTSATRLHKSMLERLQKAGMTGGALHAAISGQAGFNGGAGSASPAPGGGPGGLAPSVPSSPRVGGYGFLVTPSPAPGEDDDTPMFTWGAVDGTPLLLHEDDPMPGFQPFKVQEKTDREEVAERMYRRTIVKKEARGEFRGLRQDTNARATALTPGSGVTKTPRISRSATPQASGTRAQTPALSEAARKLASRMGFGSKRSGIDSQLRASYRGNTPHGTPRAARTPSGATPSRVASSSMLRTAGPVTPRMASESPALHRKDVAADRPRFAGGDGGAGGGGKGSDSAHLTDGLLQL
jgi:protein DGCR14